MKKIFSILLACIALSSCVDTVILPDDKTLDQDYWQEKAQVEGLVANAYAQLKDVTFMRNLAIWADFRSDELDLHERLAGRDKWVDALKEVQSMQLTPANLFTGWAPLYSSINYCNLVMERAQQVVVNDPNYTEGDYKANIAQVKALRALCYFYLVRVFRDVPVTPHAYMESSDNLAPEQKAPAEVLQMCIDDLYSVIDDAPDADAFYDDQNGRFTPNDRAYFNKDGIKALLADIYLWRGSVNHDAEDYKKCVDLCVEIRESKKAQHRLTPSESPADYYLSKYDEVYKNFFGQGQKCSEESILEISDGNGATINDATNKNWYQLYWAQTSQNLGKTQGYIVAVSSYGKVGTNNIYTNSDDTRRYEFLVDCDGDKTQYNVRKYIDNSSYYPTKPTSITASDYKRNIIIYRLTDVMLMEAEARVQLGETKDDFAFDLVMAVNDRALIEGSTLHLSRTAPYANDMETLVLKERARELCFEGKRWFDLLRYNYRHMNGVDYTKKLTELDGQFAPNSPEFFGIALAKYANVEAMKAKMPSEPYLYMPINEDEVELNGALKQNPVYRSVSKK